MVSMVAEPAVLAARHSVADLSRVDIDPGDGMTAIFQ
jgi:hypothetical protein